MTWRFVLFDLFLAGALMATVPFALSFVATATWGDLCWLPRLGGLMVGAAVLVQGRIEAVPHKYEHENKEGISLKRRVMSRVYWLAFFGTIYWALGDLQKDIWGMPVCQM